MRIKKAMKETFYVTSGKSCRGAAFDFCYNSFMGLITFLWSQKSYLNIMADIEKTISTKVEENYFQRDCEKIVSEKNHL